MRKPPHLIPSIITLALLFGTSMGGLGPQTLAQSDDNAWTEATNLSRSGAASEPVLVSGPEGTLQALWWDQFDGMMAATYDGETWSSATQAPIIVTRVVGEGPGARTESAPIEEMPSLADGNDYVHALWRGEPGDDTDIVPLMYSRLAIGTSEWSEPRAIGDSALVWRTAAAPDGTVHLLYVRGRQSNALPAGVYHMRSTDGGSRWSAPQPLYESAYVRLLDPSETHLWVSTGADGAVYAAWDDPRLERTFLARSPDGGDSWGEAQAIGDPEEGARRARVIPTQGEPLLLWEARRTAAGCTLYQQSLVTAMEATPVDQPPTSPQPLATTWRTPALEDLTGCPEALQVHRREGAHPILIIGNGSGSLTAVAWNGAQWSQPKSLSFSFDHPELGRRVYLDALQTALLDGRLGVVGLGQDGDVWYLESEMEAWAWAFAPPSPWSESVNVSGSEDVSQNEGVPGQPAIAVDGEGQIHLLWSEAPENRGAESALYYTSRSQDRWSRPAVVLQSPEGMAQEPALVTAGDRLHALWSGGWSSAIYYSQAYARDAYGPDGWSEPRVLPLAGATGSSPDVLIDARGTLHVVYAVPLNEGRGITYVRSDDSGETWSEPQGIFDADAAGWAMVDHPTLAMDPAGTLHVAWVRGSQDGPFPPQGIFYVHSTDGGRTWSEMRVMAEGAYDWPRIAAPLPGQVYLLWNEVTDGGAYLYRWSADHGASWTYQQQVGGFRDIPGPVGLTSDGAGTLHLVGLGWDETGEPAVRYTTWDSSAAVTTGDGRWSEQESLRLALVEDFIPGTAIGLDGAQGWLSVAFRAEVDGEQGPRHEVLYAGRSVPTVEAEPEPSYTPVPTAMPTPSPMPTPTPTPRPTVPAQPPAAGPPALDLGVVTLPVTALGGLGVATLIVVGVLVGRRFGRGTSRRFFR